jgi:hypothetical protein
MKIHHRFLILSSLLLLPLLLTGYLAGGQKKNEKNKYLCSESNPASICSPANTCGSASTPCVVDIRRKDSTFATATPNIPDAKGNAPFCVKVGTTVTWQSGSKNTGFVIDFGPTAPFDIDGAIMGGADRPISVVAKRAGCYKYSVGACTAGTIYGMCGNADAEIVATAAN